LLALFGGVDGSGACGLGTPANFYALFFLQSILIKSMDTRESFDRLVAACSPPASSSCSARCRTDWPQADHHWPAGLIAALTFFPDLRMITTNANPALEKAIESVRSKVVADSRRPAAICSTR